jgi:hypothetical protein
VNKMEQHNDLLILKGMISDLPEERKNKINAVIAALKDLIKNAGDDGIIALAYVGIESQLEIL